ncbi:sensor histidine kinase [Fibrella sp. WM1]|uniref:sensor histidine kinase n=1 Tax=Fibrella musci TaxID=3242485 RepID=UPI003521E572
MIRPQTLLRKLKAPYPQPFDVSKAFRKALLAGILVSLVNLTFQPFGLSSFEHPYKTWVLLGFGVPVFFWVGVLGVLVPMCSPSFWGRQQEHWTLWKQLLISYLITVCITVSMYFYAQWIEFAPFASIGYLVVCSFFFGALVSLFFLFFDQNTYLAEVDRRSTAESEELKMLIRESHHRMRNHLQVIASILRLQTSSITDERALEALRTSEKRLESIAILHEKLYCNESVSRVDLRAYLEELIEIIARHHAELTPNVAIQVEDYAALRVPLDTAVPLGLIVNELITNSFKHAFRTMDNGAIQLILDQSADGRNRLIVRDNGPGVPDEVVDQPGTSLGMRLVKALTQQLKGQLSYSSNGGAEFVVQF